MTQEEQQAMMFLQLIVQEILPLETVIKIGEDEKAIKVRVYKAKKDGSLVIVLKEAQDEEKKDETHE